jgi:hypothetical protein
MRVVTRAEEKQYLLKDQYGLSILGTDLNGRLESNSELEEKIVKYSRTGQMTFMTLLINEDAAKRMLEFFTVFSSDEEDQGSPKNHYGGAFYPRYYGEGAGCSAFVISFLELGALFEEEYDGWRIELDLPRDLMGGPYNEGNEVRLKDIRNRDHWADEGDSKTTYEPFEIYDPTLISEWITEIFMDPKLQDEYQAWPVELNKAKGILIDGRHVPAPVEESIFIEREKPSVFIR